MANRILKMEGWEKRIQDKLGVDPAYLPDESIRQPDIIGVAEANIISQIPDYATLEGDAKVYLESAVVLECCVLLCPSMSARLPKKEGGPHMNHELWVNWDNKKIQFEEEKNTCIGKVLEIAFPSLISPTLPYFTATYPKREWQGK